MRKDLEHPTFDVKAITNEEVLRFLKKLSAD